MATIKLLEPVRGSLTSLRFFNGRLLTGSDLTREQQTLYHRDERLGAALGSGVLDGLDVALDPAVEGQPPSVQITAGHAISPAGDLLALPEPVQLILEIPTPPPPKGNPDWRRCVSESSAAPLPPRSLYLLTMRPSPRDSRERAHVLQIDRSTDPCTTSFLEEAVVFRLLHMHDLEAALRDALVGDAHLRSAVAHACFATHADPGALAALRAEQGIDMDHDVAIAVIHLGPAARWLDTWSVRRSVAPQPNHHPIAGLAGPRDRLEAEARLLQFQAQLAQLPTPPAAPADPALLDGRAGADFQWLPPAGELPLAWGDAWRHFLGPWMAPAIAYPCDARLLPALLEAAAMAASIAPTPTDDSAPALDVYVGRAAGEGPDLARIYVHSSAARALIRLGPAERLSDSVLAGLKVRLVNADGLQSWAMHRSPDRLIWLSPDVPPGTYSVEVDSAEVGAEPIPVDLIGGRVRRGDLQVEPRTGILDIEIGGDLIVQALQVRAKKDTQILAAHPNGVGHWLIVGVPPGEWTITAAGTANGDPVSQDADAVVEVDTTTEVTIAFVAEVEPPPRSVTFKSLSDGRPLYLKLAMLEISITDAVGILSKEVRTAGFYEATRGQKTTSRSRTLGAKVLRSSADAKLRGGADEDASGIKRYLNFMSKEPVRGITQKPPPELQAWLHAWRLWLAHNEPGAQARKAILAAAPHLELEHGQTLATLAARTSPPGTPEAWAVFGPTRLPLVVVRERVRSLADTLRPDLLLRLKPFQRARFPFVDLGIDILASLPKDILAMYFDPEDVPELGADFWSTAVREHDAVATKLGGYANNWVAIANAQPGDLKFDDEISAKVAIAHARKHVSRESWSPEAAGIPQAAALADRGLRSLGDITRRSTEDVRSMHGLSEADAETIHSRADATLLEHVASEALDGKLTPELDTPDAMAYVARVNDALNGLRLGPALAAEKLKPYVRGRQPR